MASEFGGGFCYIIEKGEEIKEVDEQSVSVASEFGNGICYIIEEGEEIKEEVWQHIPLQKYNNNNKGLEIESYNACKD